MVAHFEDVNDHDKDCQYDIACYRSQNFWLTKMGEIENPQIHDEVEYKLNYKK